MTSYLILGTGAAGMAAAETIRHYDRDGEIICATPESEGYYSRPGLAYYLSKELNERSLFPFSPQDFQEKTIRVAHKKAVRIDQVNHQVVFDDQSRQKYDRLLLATGARAVRPDLPGVDSDGVFYLDTLAQTKQIIKKTTWNKRAVVIGGGITALEIVEGLLTRKQEVHYFLRGEHYWGRVLDQIESDIVLSRLEHAGVRIHKNTELEQLITSNGKVKGVLTNNGQTIKAGLVAFAIGVQPRLKLAAASRLEVNRGVITNQYLETSAEDVYAAGDLVEIQDPATGISIVNSLWNPARQQGITAGLNMIGRRTVHQHRTPLNVTRLAGITTTIIGRVGTGKTDVGPVIVRGESEIWQQDPRAVICQNSSDVNRLRIMVGKQTLLGAVLMGDQSLSKPLAELVAHEIDISSIRQRLLEPGAKLPPILEEFWLSWRKKHAEKKP
jgi:NAD(P)H-nitrite reductase large subunit